MHISLKTTGSRDTARASLTSLLSTMKLAIIITLAILALCCSPGECPEPLSPKLGSGTLPAAHFCSGERVAPGRAWTRGLPARKLGLVNKPIWGT